MSKYIKIQENVYNTYLALKSRRKRIEFLEKCFIFAWENKEIKSKDDMVSIAFLGVKPSLKKIETSTNWGGLRENSGRKSNQDKNQLENQDETKLESSPFISNKEISNKEISNIQNDESLDIKDDEDMNDKRWTDLDRWENGKIDRTKYQLCYKGIVPIDWKPTMEDYEASQGSPYDISGLPRRYKFKGEMIRLNQKDFDKWKKEFNRLDLESALYRLDAWAVKNFKDSKSKLFWVIHGMLVNEQKEKIKNNPDVNKYWL